MAERKDKQKVIGEAMTDEQVRAFLQYSPEQGVNADFHLLEKAYRALRVEDFARFLVFFQDQGGDLDARNPDGQSLLDIISQHSKSAPYVAALNSAKGKN